MNVVKKLNSKNLINIIEEFRSVIININFFSHLLFYLFIDIYYNKFKSLNYFNYLLW